MANCTDNRTLAEVADDAISEGSTSQPGAISYAGNYYYPNPETPGQFFPPAGIDIQTGIAAWNESAISDSLNNVGTTSAASIKTDMGWTDAQTGKFLALASYLNESDSAMATQQIASYDASTDLVTTHWVPKRKDRPVVKD